MRETWLFCWCKIFFQVEISKNKCKRSNFFTGPVVCKINYPVLINSHNKTGWQAFFICNNHACTRSPGSLTKYFYSINAAAVFQYLLTAKSIRLRYVFQ